MRGALLGGAGAALRRPYPPVGVGVGPDPLRGAFLGPGDRRGDAGEEVRLGDHSHPPHPPHVDGQLGPQRGASPGVERGLGEQPGAGLRVGAGADR